MNYKKAASYLGFAMKAGQVKSGEFSTEKAVKTGAALLVLLASDASDNTKKKFRNMCEWYETELREFAAKAELGHMLGKDDRSVCAVTSENFAVQIMKQLDMQPGKGGTIDGKNQDT